MTSQNTGHGLTCYLARGPQRALKAACKHGHEFTPDNTKIAFSNGLPYRACVACARRSSREYARRRRGRAA